MSSPQFPEPPPSVPATSKDKVDALVARLHENKDKWAAVSIAERIRILKKLRKRLLDVSEPMSSAVAKAAGLNPHTEEAGESWSITPVTVMICLKQLIESLESGGQRRCDMRKVGDQYVAKVYPMDNFDKVVIPGVSAELWIEPGKAPSQGRIYREREKTGKVCLVLGAGNVGAIAPTDALSMLFAENKVVVMKMNPVNAYIGPFLEKMLAPLIDEGYFGIVYGGAEIGKHLTAHPQVECMHITGSDATHDRIVWGETPEEQAKNKAAGTPINDKEFSSELGCVTPVLVVPGNWSDRELRYQAAHVASMVASNASFMCIAAKVVITAKGWPLQRKFLDEMHKAFGRLKTRRAYYPGAKERHAKFVEQYPDALQFGEAADEVVPFTVIPDVEPSKDEYALQNEAFCTVIAEVGIDASSAAEFLDKAVTVANEEVWGTLSCVMIIDDESKKKNKAAYDKAISDLRYGGISVNQWGLNFGLMAPSWGAFPGHTLEDIRSGRGSVHNTCLFDHPQKSVVVSPFIFRPHGPWLVTHKNLKSLSKALLAFYANPGVLRIPKIATAALKG